MDATYGADIALEWAHEALNGSLKQCSVMSDTRQMWKAHSRDMWTQLWNEVYKETEKKRYRTKRRTWATWSHLKNPKISWGFSIHSNDFFQWKCSLLLNFSFYWITFTNNNKKKGRKDKRSKEKRKSEAGQQGKAREGKDGWGRISLYICPKVYLKCGNLYFPPPSFLRLHPFSWSKVLSKRQKASLIICSSQAAEVQFDPARYKGMK